MYTPRNRGQVLSAQYDKESARIFIDRKPVKSHNENSLQTLHRMLSESWGHRPVLSTIFFILQSETDGLPFAEIVILALRCFSRFAADVVRFAD